jgi:N-acetylneuraminate synthase
MIPEIEIGGRLVGAGHPVFIVAEIGINHNGDLEVAKRLIDAAVLAKCDAVKFQKRTPELCVPPEQKGVMRETPWGIMTYLEYRNRIEFGEEEYAAIDHYCKERDIIWFASAWDVASVDFIGQFDPPCYKIASACLTDDNLLRYHRRTGRPIILSTGMSSLEEIDHAVDVLGKQDLILLHCNSTYPAKPNELNLKTIPALKERYNLLVGYSGHEVGLQTTLAAVVLGACMIERHITLDRAMWGSDQAASVEPHGFARLVRDIRVIEEALGDGVKRVYDSELPVRKKLRRVSVIQHE